MLCPEIWDFKAPEHHFEIERASYRTREVPAVVSTHYFNHSVSVVLPDTSSVPQNLRESLLDDSDYYKIESLRASDLVNKEFVEGFVKKGELSLLTIGRKIDVHNLVAICPSGHLVLSLVREDYQKLGLEGKETFFDRKAHSRYGGEIAGKMPRKHRAPALEELALCSVGRYVTTFGKNLIKPICKLSQQNPELGITTLNELLHSMKIRLSSSVPWHLYDRMATEALRSIMNLINETKISYNDFAPIGVFLSEVNVVVSLIEVVVHGNLRTIEFAAWPKIMRHVLYNNLHKMTGLEVLDLGSGSAGWRTSDIEKIIINGVATMPNLVSFTLCFDCTDNIIGAVSQNCPRLRYLDVTASRSVTDRSVAALLKSRVLREVKLFRTSVSTVGYANLLSGHSRLEDIGRCDDIGDVLEDIRNKENYRYDKEFHLRAFESRNVAMNHLYLLISMCPYITRLSLMCDERISDLTILAALENLTELKLLSCYFYADCIKTLIELTNSRITTLHLEHVEEIDRSALVYISQFCPEIRNLTFYNCELLDHTTTHFRKLPIAPFKYLERMKCVADCDSVHLEFLLSHCTNVKFIQLGSSTGIGDTTMKKVFSQNPMTKLEELKILYSDDLSMRTVRLLMQNCENLRRLSELESWQGISSDEIKSFREELRVNNIDLDTSPTLSLA